MPLARAPPPPPGQPVWALPSPPLPEGTAWGVQGPTQLHTGPERGLTVHPLPGDLGPVAWPLAASVYLSVSWGPPASGEASALRIRSVSLGLSLGCQGDRTQDRRAGVAGTGSGHSRQAPSVGTSLGVGRARGWGLSWEVVTMARLVGSFRAPHNPSIFGLITFSKTGLASFAYSNTDHYYFN